MFRENSRYHGRPMDEVAIRKGETVTVVRLRRLAPTEGETLVMKEIDRLDVLAHRRYGDATRFWHIADANTELDARELVRTPGRTVDVPDA